MTTSRESIAPTTTDDSVTSVFQETTVLSTTAGEVFTAEPEDGGGDNTTIIIAVCASVGGVLIIAVIILIIFKCCRRGERAKPMAKWSKIKSRITKHKKPPEVLPDLGQLNVPPSGQHQANGVENPALVEDIECKGDKPGLRDSTDNKFQNLSSSHGTKLRAPPNRYEQTDPPGLNRPLEPTQMHHEHEEPVYVNRQSPRDTLYMNYPVKSKALPAEVNEEDEPGPFEDGPIDSLPMEPPPEPPITSKSNINLSKLTVPPVPTTSISLTNLHRAKDKDKPEYYTERPDSTPEDEYVENDNDEECGQIYQNVPDSDDPQTSYSDVNVGGIGHTIYENVKK